MEDDKDIPLSVLHQRLHLDPSLTFEDYLNINRDVITSEFESEEDIMAAVQSQTNINEEASEDNEDDIEATHEEPPPISTNEALQKVRDLQRYFMTQQNTKDDDFSKLSELESVILKKSSLFSQTAITNFFHPCD